MHRAVDEDVSCTRSSWRQLTGAVRAGPRSLPDMKQLHRCFARHDRLMRARWCRFLRTARRLSCIEQCARCPHPTYSPLCTSFLSSLPRAVIALCHMNLTSPLHSCDSVSPAHGCFSHLLAHTSLASHTCCLRTCSTFCASSHDPPIHTALLFRPACTLALQWTSTPIRSLKPFSSDAAVLFQPTQALSRI